MNRKISGYVKFKTDAGSAHGFLNECKNTGIVLRNVRTQNGFIFFLVKNKDVEKCRDIGEQYSVLLEECGKRGLINKFKLYKRRKVFAVFFIIMLTLFVLRSFYITEITVTGNNYLTDSQIIQVLSECGVKKGNLKFFLNQREIQKNITAKCEHISWVWVQIKGTHVMVEVREKVSIPEFFDTNYICNIIASRDGVITEAVASSGKMYTKAGEYVRKGDLLIGGVYDSTETAPVRFVHASGNVLARTQYSIEDDFGSEYTKYSLAGKKKSYGIKIGGLKLEKNINKQNILLSNDSEKKIKIFGKFYLPLSFTKREYCEIIEEKHKCDEEYVKNNALSELSKRLELIIPPHASVVNSEEIISTNPDGTMHVRLILECIENIGVESPIEITYE